MNATGLFGVLSGFVVPPPILPPRLHHYRGPPKDQSLYTSVNAAGWWYRIAAELASMSAQKQSQFSHIGRIMELSGFGHLRLGNTRCQTCQQGGHECWYTDLLSSPSHRGTLWESPSLGNSIIESGRYSSRLEVPVFGFLDIMLLSKHNGCPITLRDGEKQVSNATNDNTQFDGSYVSFVIFLGHPVPAK